MAAGLSSCSGDCPGCEVEVQPAAVNQPPVANAASVSVAENASVGIRLSGADADGSVVDYRVVRPPANGTLSGSAPDLTYAPNADFHGPDAFTFAVADDDGAVSAPAEVSITVTPVNDAPVAVAQSVEVAEGESVDIVLEGTDADGAVVAYTVTAQPMHGVLGGTAPDLVYSPDAGYVGTDGFAFTVTDDEGAVSSPAEVAIEVTPMEVAACPDDRSVLETFYWATEGDGWTDSEGWLVEDDLNDWHGVVAQDGCVVELSLPVNGLAGVLPWELGSLAMLERLSLWGLLPPGGWRRVRAQRAVRPDSVGVRQSGQSGAPRPFQ